MSTYTPIATQTLGSAASSVTFSSLPQNYTDLVLVLNVKGSAANFPSLRFNGDSGSNYSRTILTGNGSAASSARGTNESAANINYNAQTSSSEFNYNSITHIQNYSNSTTYKTQLTRANQAALGTDAVVTLWRNTNAITQIDCITNTGNYASGSTFTIYGVAAGNSSAKATGGNIVTTDGTYWYHTFTSSGVFIPSQALTVDYLVVAGGGGGGGYRGGGGGAGGMRCTVGGTGGSGSLESPLSLSANTVYQAIIGAGGTNPNINPYNGTNGNNSTFSTITSTGGGYGGWDQIGAAGGSGGGGGNGSFAGGAGTANQGYAGATGGSAGSGGGGGGASAVGTAGGSGGTGGAGGAGRATSISGTSITYAAGGKGGDNTGSGATAGTVYTGNGGAGGNGGSSPGAAGGSGIIIIRYAV